MPNDLLGLAERLYEVVRHDPDCRAIGGAGDNDCTCDAVPVLRKLEAMWNLPVGQHPVKEDVRCLR